MISLMVLGRLPNDLSLEDGSASIAQSPQEFIEVLR
jgi:hypothetical protein